jgi:ABC-type sugar transport system ATPase subunit
MCRATEIIEKIAYAETQRQKLMKEMFAAKKQKVKPAFIVHTAAEILSIANECYDYCGSDIVDEIIIPNTENTKLIKKHENRRLRAYFPIRKQQLTNKSEIFYELKNIDKKLHDHLYNLAARIEKNKIIPETNFQYGDIATIRTMVNKKKHDRLTVISSKENQEVLIENQRFKMVVPLRGQVGWNKLVVGPKSEAQIVSEYRFEYNDKEVGHFCMIANKMTERILGEIYNKFFGISISNG